MGCAIGFFLHSALELKEGKISSSTIETANIRACFSPEGHCTNLITSTIENAKSSILVQAYSFTCPQIATALAKAFERGVDVKILIHKSQLSNRHSQVSFLLNKGIPIFIDPAVGIAHNKTMIFDGRQTLTGSFNWSEAANTRNAENLLLIEDHSLAQIYKDNWEKRAIAAKVAVAE